MVHGVYTLAEMQKMWDKTVMSTFVIFCHVRNLLALCIVANTDGREILVVQRACPPRCAVGI